MRCGEDKQSGGHEQRSEKPLVYAVEQRKDRQLKEIVDFLSTGSLPEDGTRAKLLASQETLFTLVNGILYYVDPKGDHRRRVAVPEHLQTQLMDENHRGRYSGHFSGPKLYNAMVKCWWWKGMYKDVLAYCKECPECAVATGVGRQRRPPLHPIPIERPFQVVAVDIMDLLCTENDNKHVVVFQDMFTKWPMVYAVPDQKAERLAKLLFEGRFLEYQKLCCPTEELISCWIHASLLG